ncbi:MAG: hypothetical protein ABIE23_05630 [archaeon]
MKYELAFGDEERTIERKGEKELNEILAEINELISKDKNIETKFVL